LHGWLGVLCTIAWQQRPARPLPPSVPDCPFAIGNTPLTRSSLTVNGLAHEIYLKEERLNAFGSIKDRVAWYILSRLVEEPGAARAAASAGIIDASSGNYGYALASIGRAQGLKVTIISSASISRFNAEGIRRAGGELVIAEPQAGESSNHARMRVAGERAARGGQLFLDQYRNQLNPQCHARWTAPEVLESERLDAVFVAASSGGTARTACAGQARKWRAGLTGCHSDPVAVPERIAIAGMAGGRPGSCRRIPGLTPERRLAPAQGAWPPRPYRPPPSRRSW
jgi:cysteine synthase